MKDELIISISGIRGIVGKTLRAETALQAGKAYGRFVNGGQVVVGGDSRSSHLMLKTALISGLLATGCEVMDIGICPTPTIAMAILGTEASGGVALTASHNPIQWNGLKFFNKKSEFITSKEFSRFNKLLVSEDIPTKSWRMLGSIGSDFSWVERHINAVAELDCINLNMIRRSKFRVVIDAVNGGGAIACPQMLEKLGCSVMRLNCVPDGHFPHTPEPLPKNLKMLSEAVADSEADIGFAVDPDADRLAIVDERGVPIGEENTLAIAADFYLSQKKGPMVINMSTSNINQDICNSHKCKLYRSKVGEANVVHMMKLKKAVIGGEGNGGVILPELHYGRDSLVGMALVLSALAESKQTVSEYVDGLGKYVIVKSKGNITKGFDVKLNGLRKKLTAQKITTVDGIRVDFNNGWVHIRKSNTEPIYRLIAEAETKKEANALIKFIKDKL